MITIDEEANHKLVLPVDPNDFSEFIAKLLGKPQTIERKFESPFIIRKDDISHAFELVRQRIESQNDATLAQFSARILYNDNSSVLLNSIDEVILYNEIKPIISTGVDLSWRWLIKFRGSNIPEKQEIEISFRTKPSRPRSPIDDPPITIFTRISHTDRTWGSDIDLLMKGYSENLIQQEGAGKLFAQNYVGYFVLIAFVISFFALGWAISGLFSSYSNHQFELASELWRGKTDMAAVLAHLDFITKRITSNDSGLFRPLQTIAYATAIIVSGFIAMFTGSTLSERRPSFVALTRQAEERMSVALKQHDNGVRNVALSSIGAIALAACGRVAGEYLIRTFMS